MSGSAGLAPDAAVPAALGEPIAESAPQVFSLPPTTHLNFDGLGRAYEVKIA